MWSYFSKFNFFNIFTRVLIITERKLTPVALLRDSLMPYDRFL